MMNHHFFGGEDERTIFEKFMEETEDKKVAIVVDPPFGIMVEALAVTLAKIRNERTMINTGTPLPHFCNIIIGYFVWLCQYKETTTRPQRTLLKSFFRLVANHFNSLVFSN